MKKLASKKDASRQEVIGPDMAGLVAKMQEQLVSLERKMDVLISRSEIRSPGVNIIQRPFQRIEQPASEIGKKQENRFANRVMHKAICADCNKACEVPFRPSGDRPVYCKECFSKRKNGGSFNERRIDVPKRADHVQAVHPDKPKVAGSRKSAGKKKPQARRRK